ncbi:MAG: hypothetical protein HYR85_15790 [Planctomycetes bacterium]|nr:hypothetical protein [Planctomycetota bacterium]MBI3848107.1 hypothetical protein [Planctomycetota bacterium]
MKHKHRSLAIAALAVTCSLAAFLAHAAGQDGKPDPLAADIHRWSDYVKSNTSTDELWAQVKSGAAPILESADQSLRDGRRWLALTRLAAVRVNLAASVYASEHAAGQFKDDAALEAEWTRMGGVLRDALGPTSPNGLDGVAPAAVRAQAEVALPQVRGFYDTSLEYAKNTAPEYGLFYIGQAQAQRDFVALCRSLSAATSLRAPPLRDLRAELDALETEMLAAYRPPVSINRHPEFIVASSTLNEARELDAAGLRYGALLRYLQAALRFAPLRATPATLDKAALASTLHDLDARLSAAGVDHTIGRTFLEAAQAEVAAGVPFGGQPAAATIVTDVLPRYFAALEPAKPAPPKPAAQVKVTLVRWPYT